ncbi:MAG: Coenzyme F420 hydrogenase/dehydrogenase, beta subunit C-terminal domain, partial [Clostridia bacterium]
MIEKIKCYGCGACSKICPKNAIIMKMDKKGFFYPEIEKEKCIQCGLCEKVCWNPESNNEYFKEPLVYAVKSKDMQTRLQSSSGGVFTQFAKICLEENGVVYGACYAEDFEVKHIRIGNIEEIQKLRGSKYVQSNLKNVYSEVKKDLQNGKKVMFVGTPCQVYGLNQYLRGIDKLNLILVDLVCHGVTSPKIWKDYITFIERKYHGKLSKYTFRNKEKGWRGYHPLAKFDNGRKIESRCITSYTNLFSTDLALREGCYQCNFSSTHRKSDITIGDFWGLEKTIPEFIDDLGVSLVLINT